MYRYGIAVCYLDPGHVQTHMSNYKEDLSPEESVKKMTTLLTDMELRKTGAYYKILPSDHSSTEGWII